MKIKLSTILIALLFFAVIFSCEPIYNNVYLPSIQGGEIFKGLPFFFGTLFLLGAIIALFINSLNNKSE